MVGAFSFVIVLAGLIFFHELGHFLAARSLKIGVQTFSLGFGPAIVSWHGKKTKYQISWIPLGGYVSLVGEQKDKSIPAPFTESECFSSRPAWHRLIVVSAGPIFNFILAIVLFAFLALAGNGPYAPEIGALSPNSPSENKLQEGDIITQVNGTDVSTWGEAVVLLMNSDGKDVDISFIRNDMDEIVTITPTLLTESDSQGNERQRWIVGIAPSGRSLDVGLIEAIKIGSKETINNTKLIAGAVFKLVTGQASLKDLGGPIMIAKVVSDQATNSGLFAVLGLTALLSINLGLLNLLPIPALDGGHVIFCLAEIVTRRPVPIKIQAISSYIGISLLLMLMVFATFMDITRITG